MARWIVLKEEASSDWKRPSCHAEPVASFDSEQAAYRDACERQASYVLNEEDRGVDWQQVLFDKKLCRARDILINIFSVPPRIEFDWKSYLYWAREATCTLHPAADDEQLAPGMLGVAGTAYYVECLPAGGVPYKRYGDPETSDESEEE